MSRDKQIEEMAQDVCVLYKDFGSCERCDAELDIGDEPCVHKCFAKAFYNAGYRKADEVAREIFEEIETIFVEMIEEATDQLASARLECDLKAVKIMDYGIDVLRLAYCTLKKSLKNKYKEGKQ